MNKILSKCMEYGYQNVCNHYELMLLLPASCKNILPMLLYRKLKVNRDSKCQIIKTHNPQFTKCHQTGCQSKN